MTTLDKFLVRRLLLYTCYAVLGRSGVSDSLRPCGLQPTRPLCPWGLSRQEYWGRFPCPPPGDLPNPGVESRSPALQADSSPFEQPGVGSLSLLQQIFQTQGLNQGLLHCRRILYQLSYQGSPLLYICESHVGFLTVIKWMNCGDSDLISLHLKLPRADSRSPHGSATHPGSFLKIQSVVQPCQLLRNARKLRRPRAKGAWPTCVH